MLIKSCQLTKFLRYFELEICKQYDTRIVILVRFFSRESVLRFYARITILIGRIVIITQFYSRESVFYLRENRDSGLENRDSHAILFARICFFYLRENHDSGRENRDSRTIFFARINFFIYTRITILVGVLDLNILPATNFQAYKFTKQEQ
jgi:hypothetical protein